MGAHLHHRTSTSDCTFLMTKRGIYYFRRSVPVDLKQFFRRQRIVVSLRTRDLRVAKARATEMSIKLQHELDHLRWRESANTFSDFITSVQTDAGLSDAPILTAACDFYAGLKGKNKPKTFHQSLTRAVRYLSLACGDKPIDTYDRSDANHFRDDLLKRGLSPVSVAKTLSIIRAMLNFVCREKDIDPIQAFSAVFLDDETKPEKRIAVPTDALRSIQIECRQIDDESRWIIALISDSGMRLSEALGLSTSDLVLDAEHPYLMVREHSWRRLKTPSSNRRIPLVGSSLWAVRQALAATTNDRLFPKYCVGDTTKSNSASGALNKWLKNRLSKGAVIHSFRHSIRDRLRNVECPPEIADAVGGWSRAGVGSKYGDGHSIEVLHKWLKRIELP